MPEETTGEPKIATLTGWKPMDTGDGPRKEKIADWVIGGSIVSTPTTAASGTEE